MIAPIPFLLAWCRRHRLATLLAALLLAVASLAGARRLTFDTDVLSLLPRDGRTIPAFRTFVESFGSLDQLYVVFTAADGHAIDEYEADVAEWARRLAATPGIARVDTGLVDRTRDLGWLGDRQLLFLKDAALDAALARLGGPEMRAALAARRELLALPSAGVAELVRADPLGLYDLVRAELGGAQAGINLGVTEGGYISDDGRRRLLIAHPSEPPFDTRFSRGLLAQLQALGVELAADSRAKHGEDRLPPLDVQFAGGHLIAVETEALVRRESITNTIGALALILAVRAVHLIACAHDAAGHGDACWPRWQREVQRRMPNSPHTRT